MKLSEQDQALLPLACKVCPDAMWMLTGKAENARLKCFCRQMHAFTWPMKDEGDEILDCDLLYQQDEEESYPQAPMAVSDSTLQARQAEMEENLEEPPAATLSPFDELEVIPE